MEANCRSWGVTLLTLLTLLLGLHKIKAWRDFMQESFSPRIGGMFGALDRTLQEPVHRYEGQIFILHQMLCAGTALRTPEPAAEGFISAQSPFERGLLVWDWERPHLSSTVYSAFSLLFSRQKAKIYHTSFYISRTTISREGIERQSPLLLSVLPMTIENS